MKPTNDRNPQGTNINNNRPGTPNTQGGAQGGQGNKQNQGGQGNKPNQGGQNQGR